MLKFGKIKETENILPGILGKVGEKMRKTEEKSTLYSVKQSCYNKTKSILPQGGIWNFRSARWLYSLCIRSSQSISIHTSPTVQPPVLLSEAATERPRSHGPHHIPPSPWWRLYHYLFFLDRGISEYISTFFASASDIALERFWSYSTSKVCKFFAFKFITSRIY